MVISDYKLVMLLYCRINWVGYFFREFSAEIQTISWSDIVSLRALPQYIVDTLCPWCVNFKDSVHRGAQGAHSNAYLPQLHVATIPVAATQNSNSKLQTLLLVYQQWIPAVFAAPMHPVYIVTPHCWGFLHGSCVYSGTFEHGQWSQFNTEFNTSRAPFVFNEFPQYLPHQCIQFT